MNHITPAPGTGVFASVNITTQSDDPQAFAAELTVASIGSDAAADGCKGRAGSPLSRLHAAVPQYRQSLFRR